MNKILVVFTFIFQISRIKLEETSNLLLLSDENRVCNSSIDFQRLDTDCSKYYRCINNRLKIFSCPTGYYYEQSNKLCQFSRFVDCSINNNNINNNKQPKPKTILMPESNACDVNLINKPASNDCSSYYKCIKNELKIFYCPKNYKFDSNSKFCVIESLAICIHNSINEIQINDIQLETKECQDLHQKMVPNSFCTKFYLCKGQKLKLLSCPIPFLYDSDRKKCNYANQVFCLERIIDSKRFFNNKELTFPISNDSCNLQLHRTPVPNTHCSEFFFCFENKLVKLNCPINLRFDSYKKMCFYENQVKCNTEIKKDKLTTAHIEKIQNKKIYCSFKTLVPGKCNKFYCISSEKLVKIIDCPMNFLFDSRINECNYEKEVKCISSNNDFYSKNYSISLNSKDGVKRCDMRLHKKMIPETFCTQFFYCINNKLTQLVCPVNLLFDEAKQICNYAEKVSCREIINLINNHNLSKVVKNESTISNNSFLIDQNLSSKISEYTTLFHNKSKEYVTNIVLQELVSLSKNTSSVEYKEFYTTLNIDTFLTTLSNNLTFTFYSTNEINNFTSTQKTTQSFIDTTSTDSSNLDEKINTTKQITQNSYPFSSSKNLTDVYFSFIFKNITSPNSDNFETQKYRKNATKKNNFLHKFRTYITETETTQFPTSSYSLPISTNYAKINLTNEFKTYLFTNNLTIFNTTPKISYHSLHNERNFSTYIFNFDKASTSFALNTQSKNQTDEAQNDSFFADIDIKIANNFLNKSQENSTFLTTQQVNKESLISKKIDDDDSFEDNKEFDKNDESFEFEQLLNISKILNLTQLADSVLLKINSTEFEISIDLDSNDTIIENNTNIFVDQATLLDKTTSSNFDTTASNYRLLLKNSNITNIEKSFSNISDKISLISTNELDKYIYAIPAPLSNFDNFNEIISSLKRLFNDKNNQTKSKQNVLNKTIDKMLNKNISSKEIKNAGRILLKNEKSSIQQSPINNYQLSFINNSSGYFIDWCKLMNIGLVPACLNGASCQNAEHPIEYMCICQSKEYSGRFCETKL